MYGSGCILTNLTLPHRYKDTPIVTRRVTEDIQRGMLCGSLGLDKTNEVAAQNHSNFLLEPHGSTERSYVGVSLSDGLLVNKESVEIAYVGMVTPVLFDPVKMGSGYYYPPGTFVQPNDAGDAVGLATPLKQVPGPGQVIVIGALACAYTSIDTPSEPVLLPVYLCPWVYYRVPEV
jgi:hypothetical protein